MAIGAQNAFVLRQGIRREHVLPVVLLCGLTDAVLMLAGVAGIGWLIEEAPGILEIIRWAGVAFLVAYAAFSIKRMLTPQAMTVLAGQQRSPLWKTLLGCAAITYLNPHVYLDTVLLVGSIAASQGDPGRWWFWIGAASASIVWFFSLGFGARFLTQLFARPRAWQILDGAIAIIMLVIAYRVAVSSF